MSVRVRVAPSPTGNPHLGFLRTAVFDYLLARGQGGTFILRIEDTDQKREVPGSTEYIVESLKWLGLEVDEGVYIDDQGILQERGSYGPYQQSHRLPIYREHVEKLLDSGAAYHCFCTSERLEALRNEQQANHQPPRYDRHCRSIPLDEAKARAATEVYVIRHAIPDGQVITFTDAVRGEVTFQSDELDDYVLLKSDGFPTYQLANVVDDHLMEITHVLRGEEWLPSTPKNLLLYGAFGWEPPTFAHTPVILGPDGKHKLSKRDGAHPVLDYREMGYLPAAIINFLAFVGWSPGTEEEFMTVDELANRFSLDRVQRAPAVFDQARLDYINGWYIRQLPIGDLVEYMLPYLLKAELVQSVGQGYLPLGQVSFPQPSFGEYLLAVGATVQERLKHFDETAAFTQFFFKRPVITEEIQALVVPKKETAESVKATLNELLPLLAELPPEDWNHSALEELLRGYAARTEKSTGAVLWPIRAALTGESASPGAFEMLTTLGKEESTARLQALLASW